MERRERPEEYTHRICCESVAQSISARLADRTFAGRWTAEEYRDLYRTLRDIEDRLYGKGEYAPSNAARIGGAR